MVNNEIVLELKNISKSYGTECAVKDISFTIKKGEFISLIGPSGCGKSTILRSIAGFVKPDKGDIYIKGLRINDIPPYKRNVGLVFQNYALWPHMNVFDNVAFGLKIRGIKEKKELKDKVDKILEVVRLSGLGQRFPTELSGGQQQRVALARAIVINPEVLLLDEPLSNLDRKLRIEMQIELKILQQEFNITTVYVTHDQEEALSLSDRLLVMGNHKVMQEGAPMDIYENPKNKYVASFIGSTNFFRGEVIDILVDNFQAKLKVNNKIFFYTPSVENLIEKDIVDIFVRPEKIKIYINKPRNNINIFLGVVQFITYQGSVTRYCIELEDKSTVLVDETIAKKQHSVNDKLYLEMFPKILK